MGVSINAYRRLKKRPDVIAGDDCAIDPETREELHDLWRAYKNPNFPGRADEIEDRAYYEYEEFVEGMDRSYGGYNLWRDQLAEMVGWPRDNDHPRHGFSSSAWKPGAQGPFLELINFADNEGVIGAAVCQKLAKEFAEWQSKADAHPHPYFREGYAEMRRAFEAGADGGAVDFS